MPFVQLPGIPDREVRQIEPAEDFLERVDGALQDRGVRHHRNDPGLAQLVPGAARLLVSRVGQRHVGPAGEPVLPIPDALPVTEENQNSFGTAHPDGTSGASLAADGAGIPSSFAFSSNISLSIRAWRS